MSLDKATSWCGTSPEGLQYEIVFWGETYMCEGTGMWNYYVYLPERQFTAEVWNGIWLTPSDYWERSSGTRIPTYDYWSSILSNAEWHGGITFYEKRTFREGEECVVKVGCDYGHAFDRDFFYQYSLEDVQRDALLTCKDLGQLLNPLVRCSWFGYYFDRRFDVSQDVPGWQGSFLSPAGLGARSRSRREYNQNN